MLGPVTRSLNREDSFDFIATPPASPKLECGPSDLRPEFNFPFLRADHSFDASTLANPSSSRDPANICLSFNEGDTVYVYSRHESGWADVKQLRTSMSGWVPLNYFSALTNPHAIPLLSAAANFVRNPRNYRTSSGYTFSQGAINEVIAGVRSALASAGSLNRNSAVTQRSPEVHRTRKALLTELAQVVCVAKQNKRSTDPAVAEKLVRGVLRTAQKTIALLDSYEEDVRIHGAADEEAEDSNFSQRMSGISSVGTSDGELAASDRENTPRAHSEAGDRSSGRLNKNSSESCLRSNMNRPCSFHDHTSPPKPLDRLHEVMDAIRAYTSYFTQPASSPFINPLEVTRRSMVASRELLAVVDAASLPDPSADLEVMKDDLYRNIRRLLTATRGLVAATSTSSPRAREKLGEVATECLRLAEKCAKRTELLLAANPSLELPNDRCYPDFADMMDSGKQPTPDASKGESKHINFKDPFSPRAEHSPQNSIDSTNSAGSAESAASAASAASVATEASADPLDSSGTVISLKSDVAESFHKAAPIDPQHAEDVAQTTENVFPFTELVFRNGRIRGGTLPALVAWLTSRDATSFLRSAFLLSFRLFAEPYTVALELAAQDSTRSNHASKLARLWIESFWAPEDGPALSVLGAVAGEYDNIANRRRELESRSQLVVRPLDPDMALSSKSRPQLAQRRQSSTVSVLGLVSSSRRASRGVSHDDLRTLGLSWGSAFKFNPGSESGVSSGADVAANKLLELDATDIATQLTLMTTDVFLALRPDELIDQRFAVNKRELGLSPHVVQLVQASNHLSTFVADTILGTENQTNRSRVRILKLWLKVANELYTMGNLNSTLAIVLALQSSKISRLRRLWESLSPKNAAIMQRLTPLSSPERNFAEYRKEQRKLANEPCIPYIGLFLSDLTLIDEGNVKILESPAGTNFDYPVINFDRYVRSAKVIAQLQRFQRNLPSGGTANASLQTWLRSEMAKSHSAVSRDSDNHWRRSCVIEP